MKYTILAVLGGGLFWVASVSFACEGCHGPGKQTKTPVEDELQSTVSIPHPLTSPSLQLNKESTRLDSNQKQHQQ